MTGWYHANRQVAAQRSHLLRDDDQQDARRGLRLLQHLVRQRRSCSVATEVVGGISDHLAVAEATGVVEPGQDGFGIDVVLGKPVAGDLARVVATKLAKPGLDAVEEGGEELVWKWERCAGVRLLLTLPILLQAARVVVHRSA